MLQQLDVWLSMYHICRHAVLVYYVHVPVQASTKGVHCSVIDTTRLRTDW